MWPIVLAIVALAGLPGVSAQLYNRYRHHDPQKEAYCCKWSDKGAFEVDECSDYHPAIDPFTNGGAETGIAAAGTASQPIPFTARPSAKYSEATAKSRAHLAAAATPAALSSRSTPSGSTGSGRSGQGHRSAAPSASDGYSENLLGGVPYHAEDGCLQHQPEESLELPPMYNPQWTPAGSVSESGRSRPASKPA